MSGHGECATSKKDWSGHHKFVKCANSILGLTHAFMTSGSSEGGFNHRIASWLQLSDAVLCTLNNAEWLAENGEQKATPKIINAKHEDKMNDAYKAFFY